MMPTVLIQSFNLKSQIDVDISLQLKQNDQEPALGQIFSVYEEQIYGTVYQ